MALRETPQKRPKNMQQNTTKCRKLHTAKLNGGGHLTTPIKQKTLVKSRVFVVWWGRVDSNHRRHCQQIYRRKKVLPADSHRAFLCSSSLVFLLIPYRWTWLFRPWNDRAFSLRYRHPPRPHRAKSQCRGATGVLSTYACFLSVNSRKHLLVYKRTFVRYYVDNPVQNNDVNLWRG